MSLQPLYKKLRGIVDGIFSFSDGDGAQLKSVASNIFEVRDKDDANYGIMRGIDPVGGQDYGTKNYIDTVASSGTGALRVIKFPIGFDLASVSLSLVPGSAFVFRVMLDISQAFNNALTEITVGRGTSPALLMQITDNDPTLVDTYVVDQIADFGVGDGFVVVTITNHNKGTHTGMAVNKLIDATALFITNGVQIGDTVINKATLATALVTNLDSETQLSLGADIFVNYALKSAGTNTSVVANQLVDAGADFVTNGVLPSDWALNTTDITLSEVLSVVDLHTLSLNGDIFTATPRNYEVFFAERYEVNKNTQGLGTCVVWYSNVDN